MSKYFSALPAFAILFALAACGEDQFKGGSAPRSASVKKSTNGESVSSNNQSGANGEGVGGNSATFKYGPKSTPNDVLFIFDDSVSMGSHLANVKAGFEKLAGAEWFGDSRIAVMTTLPGNPNDLSQPHKDVNTYSGIQFEPGFLSFVSAAAFDKYKSASGQIGSYPEPLCKDEWFKPTDVNSTGKRCLSVSLQNPFHGVQCEAGMTALSQIIKKKGKLFRDGALAQVVFVSDAQDPGCKSTELKSIRPSAQALRDLVMQTNQLSGLKFHGVLPVAGGGTTKETEGEGDFGFPYNSLIKETSGILIDITASSDYSAFAQSLAKTSLPEPVFPLASKVSKITSVKVGDQVVAADKIQLAADGKSVRILGLNPAAEVQIVINFAP